MATDQAKDRAARNLRKQSTAPLTGPTMPAKQSFGGKYTHSSNISLVSQPEAVDQQQQQQQQQQQLARQSSVVPFPTVRLENTYQLGPKPDGQFPVGQAGRILRELLHQYLDGEKYQEDFARSMSQSMSQAIRARMKELHRPGSSRYKIIALCSIGAPGPHGLSIASRCLWDEAADNYVTCQFGNNSLYAVATVFAVYQE